MVHSCRSTLFLTGLTDQSRSPARESDPRDFTRAVSLSPDLSVSLRHDGKRETEKERSREREGPRRGKRKEEDGERETPKSITIVQWYESRSLAPLVIAEATIAVWLIVSSRSSISARNRSELLSQSHERARAYRREITIANAAREC